MLLDRKKEGTLQVVRAYTSPQLRAAQTAQEAAIALDIPCIAADGLREMDMGDWEGRSWESITQKIRKSIRTGMPTGVMSIHRMENVTMKC